MLTLSFGFKKPQTNDKGPIVFPALEANWQQVNDHDHDGANSKKLNAQSIQAATQTLLAANWVATSDGNYRQLVTVAAGFDYDEVQIGFRLPTGEYIVPTTERVSDTQFWAYTNDPTTNYVLIYGG